jgi:large subunit ribosomal protein L9
MYVVLRENVEKLGVKGETVYVKPGFGRNYLVPRGMALLISAPEAKILIAEHEKNAEKASEAETPKADIIIPDLEFKVKSKKDGSTYTSVTAIKIKKKLEEKGIEVKKIDLHESIKKIGDYNISLLSKGADEPTSVKVKVSAL